MIQHDKYLADAIEYAIMQAKYPLILQSSSLNHKPSTINHGIRNR